MASVALSRVGRQASVETRGNPTQVGTGTNAGGDKWLSLSALAAFGVHITTDFRLDPVFLQGVDAARFLKRVKAATKHQPHTHAGDLHLAHPVSQ